MSTERSSAQSLDAKLHGSPNAAFSACAFRRAVSDNTVLQPITDFTLLTLVFGSSSRGKVWFETVDEQGRVLLPPELTLSHKLWGCGTGELLGFLAARLISESSAIIRVKESL